MSQRIARKPRQGYEVLCELLYRPLAHLLVLVLQRTPVPPTAVALTGMVTGLWAAWLLATGRLFEAALVFQLKTILDNADGQLARTTGAVTLIGRYLDSEADLLVNAALCSALGDRAGSMAVGVFAFVALTTILGLNFNAERLYQAAHGGAAEPPPPARTRMEHVLERIYAIVYRPQDQLAERFSDWRISRRGGDVSTARAYHDPILVGILANFGLSTQLAILGVLCATGTPLVYVQVLAAQLAVVAMGLIWREIRMVYLSNPDAVSQGATR